ncbi:MAG: DUF262 domain-containing HNH endonuclease family protein [Schleiferiaceae bacterium]|nr:DUF262 domain-containing HNH endonuclease family protein [Schleiferiaceae bacterium]
MSNISATLESILFSSDYKKIFIPSFQRPYSWGKSEIADYQSDLEKIIDSDDYDHFFGLLVFVQKVASNGQPLKGQKDVIDGQQRFTTTIITLSIIRDLIEDLLDNDGGQFPKSQKQQFINTASRILNVLYNKDGEFRLVTENESLFENEFLEFIQTAAFDYPKGSLALSLYDDQGEGEKNSYICKEQHLLNFKANKSKTRDKVSYKNFKLMHKFFDDQLKNLPSTVKKLDYLKRATESILSQFRIIPFTVDSYDMAFEYFEVLNDRGLDVSALDLIKNNCLKTPGINNQEREDIFNIWTEIFSNKLDHTYNLFQFVRYAYMSQHGHITTKQVYSKYQKMLSGHSTFVKMMDFLQNNLSVSADSFKNIKKPLSSSFQKDSRIFNAINLLNSTKTVQWHSIVLRVLDYYLPNQQNVSPKLCDKILALFEELFNITFTINLVDKVANVLEKKFPEIAMSININPNDFENTLENATLAVKNLSITEDLRISLIDDQTILNHKTFRKKNDLATMVIFAIQYKEESRKGINLVTTSLEHTLPQTIESSKWPVMASMSGEEQEKAIYSIGNMMLTHADNNSKIGNKTFDEKKTLYKSRKIYDPLTDNIRLFNQNVNEWTPDIIELRAKSIATKLKQLYP